MAKSIYQRLTGRKRTLFGFSQLWLAPDHILLVRSTRFTENYQRFSLADIQAIVVTELPDRVAFQFVVEENPSLSSDALPGISGLGP